MLGTQFQWELCLKNWKLDSSKRKGKEESWLVCGCTILLLVIRFSYDFLFSLPD